MVTEHTGQVIDKREDPSAQKRHLKAKQVVDAYACKIYIATASAKGTWRR